MELFDKNPSYIRLDDDVSFQLLRTNPKLTTNVKLLYDGKNVYMDSYSVNPLLSTGASTIIGSFGSDLIISPPTVDKFNDLSTKHIHLYFL